MGIEAEEDEKTLLKAMGMRRGTRFVVVAVTGSALALCAYLIVKNFHLATRDILVRRSVASVSFQSYSNSPSGEKWALLTVTNGDTCELIFLGPFSLEFKPFRTNDVLCDQAHWEAPALVAPGSVCTLALKLPPDPRPWRASCFLRRHPLQDKLEERLPDRLGSVIPGTHGWQMDCFWTDWISH